MQKLLQLPCPRLELPSGRSVEIDPGPQDRVVVRGRRGGIEVAIRFTEAGPVLEMSAVSLTLAAQADVAVECENFRVKAKRHVQVEAGGDRVERIAGLAYTEADDVAAVARTGDVEIHAERDAVVRGSQVKLNC